MQPTKRSHLSPSDEQLIIRRLENLDSDLNTAMRKIFSYRVTAQILLVNLDRFRGDFETHPEVLRQAENFLKEQEHAPGMLSERELNFSGLKRQRPDTEISNPQERYDTPPRSRRKLQCDLSPDSIDFLKKALREESGS